MARLSLAFMIVLATASRSIAVPVAGTSSGIFLNPMGPTDMFTLGVGTDHFSFGIPTAPPGVPIGQSSTLAFLGTTVNSDVGDVFRFGTLFFLNGTLLPGTEATSVDLDATLMLTMPGMGSHMLTFPLSILNTPNTTSDPTSPDFLFFPAGVAPQFFSADGTTFALEFLGFGATDGMSYMTFSGLGVSEGSTGAIGLLARVTTPEPSMLVLLAGGLIALSRARRRA